MFKSFMVALALLLLGGSASADTPLDVLGVEKSVNDVARRAQETGDAIAKSFADQALRVIAEWKKANKELINVAFDRLDEQSRQLFTNINNIATRLENDQSVAIIDIQRTMVSAGDVASKLPLGDREPSVTFIFPTILTPGPKGTVSVHVIGARIANANPRIAEGIQVKKYSDNEIGFDVDRKAIKAGTDKVERTSFQLAYDLSKSVWYNPFTWWSVEERTRDIDLTMLPEVPGSVSLKKTVHVDDWETMEDGPHIVGGRGRDNTYLTGYNLTPRQIEDGWIVDKVAQEKERFDDNGGDGDGGSSCTGYDPHRFTDTFAAFNIQHGNKDNVTGHHDAHQNCRVWVALKRKRQIEKPLEAETKELHWNSDTDFNLPENLTSFAMEMKLYSGKSYTIQNDDQIPYALFQIIKDKKSIKFRPLPQREF